MESPTDLVTTLFWLLGGLALFLYGIEMMGTAMRKAAGPAMRKGFDLATATRWHGLAAGTVVTALIQSSSATTVMVVGFINAGLLTFENSIGLILGANIGSTVTPMIASLKLDAAGLPCMGVGFLIAFVFRRKLLRQLGWAVMGFGMVFFGLLLMKQAVGAHREAIQGWLQAAAGSGFGGQILALLAATVATAIIQSSAATIVMILALASQGVVTDLGMAIPLILGAQVGTCITSLLASIPSSLSARRAAVAHLGFNVIGVGTTLALLPVYVRVIPWLAGGLAGQVAWCHLAIRVVNAGLFLPLVSPYARLIKRVLPGEDAFSARPEFLDFTRLSDPAEALDNASKEIRRIFRLCLGAVEDGVRALLDRDAALGAKVVRGETLVDDLTQTTREFLLRVAREDLPGGLSIGPALSMHILNDVERIGDHAENLVEIAEIRKNHQTEFSPAAAGEIEELTGLVLDLGDEVGATVEDMNPHHMRAVLRQKRELDSAVERFLDNHQARLTGGHCRVISGMIFVDVVTNLRRVANHLRNVAASATSRLPEHARQVARLKQELQQDQTDKADEPSAV